jgi:hypothetical protein
MQILKVSLFAAAASIAAAMAPHAAHAATFDCNVMEVGEWMGSRIHVRCSNTTVLNGQTIRFIAIGSTNAAAARFTATGNAAAMSGRLMRVDIPTTGGANVSGCGADNCRTPTFFGLLE